jgi:hypothetical protein
MPKIMGSLLVLLCIPSLVLAQGTPCPVRMEYYEGDIKSMLEIRGNYPTLSPQEKEAARNSARELKRILSAVEVGVNHNSYLNRLADVKVVVEESLSTVPRSLVKILLLNCSLEALMDGARLWNLAVKHDRVSGYMMHAKGILRRYKTEWDEPQSRWYLQGSHREKYFEEPLRVMWSAAQAYLNVAEEQLKN